MDCPVPPGHCGEFREKGPQESQDTVGVRDLGTVRGSIVYAASFTFMSSTVSVSLEAWCPGLSTHPNVLWPEQGRADASTEAAQV